MNTILMDIQNYATSDAQLGESSKPKRITNHWDEEIFKSLLLRPTTL